MCHTQTGHGGCLGSFSLTFVKNNGIYALYHAFQSHSPPLLGSYTSPSSDVFAKGLSVPASQCTIVVVFLARFPMTDIRLCSTIGLALTQASVLSILYQSDIWTLIIVSHEPVQLFIRTRLHETLICLKNMPAMSSLPCTESLLRMTWYAEHFSWVPEATFLGIFSASWMIVIIWPWDMLKEKQLCARF